MILDRKVSLREIILLLLSISITFYTAKLTSFSPIYLIYLSFIFIYLFILIKHNYIIFTNDMYILFILLIYMLLTQFSNIQYGEFINLFVSICGYLVIRSMKYNFGITKFVGVFRYSLWISIGLLLIDSIYRLSHPGAPTEEAFNVMSNSEDRFFYLYKFNSIMFLDSNSTGLIIIILFFTILSIERILKEMNGNFKLAKFFLFFLLLGTLSRAAYMAFLIGLLSATIIRQKFSKKIIISTIGILISIPVFILTFDYFSSDASFDTKFDIFFLTYSKFQHLSIYEMLFGVGFGHASETIGIYTHLLVLTYLLEMGVFGLLIFMAFIFYYIYKFDSLVWIPVFIVGLSFFMYVGTPFLFTPLALIANIYDNKKHLKGKY